MTWTRTPPSNPGVYHCRFLPVPGIDTEPFDVELVEDHFNGGVIVRRSDGMCLTLKAYSLCEWAQRPSH